MAGGDSLELVFAEISRDLSDLRDTFALIGLLYTGKVTVKCLSTAFDAIKTYIVPRIFSNDKWLRSLGSWAIVTGCTHGIGLAYAKELAKRGFNLILIARNEQYLHKISTRLEEKYKIRTLTVCVDLSQSSAFGTIEKAILAKDIGVLVNNVGVHTDLSFFHEAETDTIEKEIDVNIKPLTMITRMVLPDMVRKNKGAIVNVSSSVQFAPSIYFTVYAATKSFMDKFTEILRYEYRKTNIVFQCLAPGMVLTKMTFKRAGIHSMGYRMDAQRYSSYAVRTLGYSNYTCGHWFHGIQYAVASMIPKWIFNPLVMRELDNMLKRSSNESKVQHEFDDIDYILNTD